ncbi:aldehyde dehydrogenase family protein [Coraliomargarita akajimensis]|uniref:Aldehyde Dehydrogenase n=1 Tax=Coraliomargarita akajimensis (strain DSM 45221 / IAM 15411 / JCM 23193 / KCTC 12865 / 04OKA010-24) TaxID=583355 RepID=D5ELS3_CORAD|nr:aldehyde dehydrogenase family protein [Coraliomargarita akajimensis]ADE53248.1 Aldehyde Dehydrogenase [Coraliomargarita akajimensis DSM 45221]
MSTPIQDYRCFINGQWTTAENGATIPVENPATAEVYATVPACSTAQAMEALDAAEKAQPAWQALPPIERAGYLYKLADGLKAKREHFAKLLVMEQGKSFNEALGEVDDTVRYMTYSAEAARRIQGEIFPADAPNEQLYIYRMPYGVTVGLCAFNYPLALIGRKVGPALITGNTMVLKPHDATPVTGCEFAQLIEESGLPAGVLSIITGTTPEVGGPLVEDPRTRLITMTGSIRAGQAINAAAANNLTAQCLELGGKAPFIVMDDADIDKAVEAAVIARYANCGQVCICSESVLIHEKVADEFTDKLLKQVAQIKVGDPMLNIGMGPSTTAPGLARVYDIVEKTIADGAELALGGKRPEGAQFEKGNWIEPTVLVNATADMTAVQEEIFGPVLPIVKISGYEEALSIHNARNDGLSAYLWTQNHSRIMHAINHMQTGTIFVNKGICGYIQGYHNGHKLSGLGGEDGIHGIEGYLQKRTIYMAW